MERPERHGLREGEPVEELRKDGLCGGALALVKTRQVSSHRFCPYDIKIKEILPNVSDSTDEIHLDEGLELPREAVLVDKSRPHRWYYPRKDPSDSSKEHECFILIFWPDQNEIQSQINLRYPEVALEKLEELVGTLKSAGMTQAHAKVVKQEAISWVNAFFCYWNQKEFHSEESSVKPNKLPISKEGLNKFITIFRQLKAPELFSFMLSNETPMKRVLNHRDLLEFLLDSIIDVQEFSNALPSMTDLLLKPIPVEHRVPLFKKLTIDHSNHHRGRKSEAAIRAVNLQLLETTIKGVLKYGGSFSNKLCAWLELFSICTMAKGTESHTDALLEGARLSGSARSVQYFLAPLLQELTEDESLEPNGKLKAFASKALDWALAVSPMTMQRKIKKNCLLDCLVILFFYKCSGRR